MGYPQAQPTSIQCDNACAVGIANNTVKLKRSKSIDMRYHWLRDRIKQQQISVFWRPGTDNLADFFTKALPVHRHQAIKHNFVHCPPNPSNLSLPRHTRRAHSYRATRLKKPP
jgi:hypothetical protein